MSNTPYSVTTTPADSGDLDYGVGAYLKDRYVEVLGLDEPEDYEPAERDYDYLDA